MLKNLFFVVMLAGLAGCQTIEPLPLNSPNVPYAGDYPQEFQDLQRQNPLLADELGKLPEIQDGISDTEKEALKKIVHLYNKDPAAFDRTFEEMSGIGIPEVRKYNTPLQALFWNVEAGNDGVVEEQMNGLRLNSLLGVWFSRAQVWDDFEVVADRLNSPELLLRWMQGIGNISYGWPGYPVWTSWVVRSPKEVFDAKNGECIAQSAFEKSILNRNGYYGHLLFVDRRGANDHGVYYWKTGEKIFYMEHSFYGFEGIYGPFEKETDIAAHVYEHLVSKDGKRSQYIMSSFDNVRPGDQWKSFMRKTTLRNTTDWN